LPLVYRIESECHRLKEIFGVTFCARGRSESVRAQLTCAERGGESLTMGVAQMVRG